MTLYTYWKQYLKNNNRYIEIFATKFTLENPLLNSLYKGKSDDIPISLADMEIMSVIKATYKITLEVIDE